MSVAYESKQHRYRGLESDHAWRCGLELAVLLEVAMRCMVGGDAVDGSIGECFAQRLAVFGLAQRRVDLASGVVADQRFVGQSEVVRRDLCGHRQAAALGFSQQAHRPQTGDVRDVIASSRRFSEDQVTGDDDVFGGARPSLEA
jgi:hypothetical protein